MWKCKLSFETAPKINIVILKPAKNLIFYQFLKEEILRAKALRMTGKG
jgi:hypothetical protein